MNASLKKTDTSQINYREIILSLGIQKWLAGPNPEHLPPFSVQAKSHQRDTE